jgi:mitogen-activated protein kinase 1/3
MTVDEALEHPYLSAYVSGFLNQTTLIPDLQHSVTYQHDPEDEPVVTPLSPSYFEFDRKSP